MRTNSPTTGTGPGDAPFEMGRDALLAQLAASPTAKLHPELSAFLDKSLRACPENSSVFDYLAAERTAGREYRAFAAERNKEILQASNSPEFRQLQALLSNFERFTLGSSTTGNEMATLEEIRREILPAESARAFFAAEQAIAPLGISPTPAQMQGIAQCFKTGQAIAEWFYEKFAVAICARRGDVALGKDGFVFVEQYYQEQLGDGANPKSLKAIVWEHRDDSGWRVAANGAVALHMWRSDASFLEFALVTPIGRVRFWHGNNWDMTKEALEGILAEATQKFGLTPLDLESKRFMQDKTDHLFAIGRDINGATVPPAFEMARSPATEEGCWNVLEAKTRPTLHYDRLPILSEAEEQEQQLRKQLDQFRETVYDSANEVHALLQQGDTAGAFKKLELGEAAFRDIVRLGGTKEHGWVEEKILDALMKYAIAVKDFSRADELERRIVACVTDTDNAPWVLLRLAELRRLEGKSEQSWAHELNGLAAQFLMSCKYLPDPKYGIGRFDESIQRVKDLESEIPPAFRTHFEKVKKLAAHAQLGVALQALGDELNSAGKFSAIPIFSSAIVGRITSGIPKYPPTAAEESILQRALSIEEQRVAAGLPALNASADLPALFAMLRFAQGRFAEAHDLALFAYRRQDTYDKEWIRTYKQTPEKAMETHLDKLPLLTDLATICQAQGQYHRAVGYLNKAASLIEPLVTDKAAWLCQLTPVRIQMHFLCGSYRECAEVIEQDFALRERFQIPQTLGEKFIQQLSARTFRALDSTLAAGELLAGEGEAVQALLNQARSRPLWSAKEFVPVKILVAGVLSRSTEHRTDALELLDQVLATTDLPIDAQNGAHLQRGLIRSELGDTDGALEDLAPFFEQIVTEPSQVFAAASVITGGGIVGDIATKDISPEKLKRLETQIHKLVGKLQEQDSSPLTRSQLLLGLIELQERLGKMAEAEESRHALDVTLAEIDLQRLDPPSTAN
jgi:tetratricopeptide (TPR) repeat protein